MSSNPNPSKKKLINLAKKLEQPSGFKQVSTNKRQLQKVLNNGHALRVKGHGDIMAALGNLKNIISAPLKAVNSVADTVSGLSGRALRMIGSGDYKEGDKGMDLKVSANSLLTGTQNPEIVNRGQAYIIRHSEYICDITPSVTFNNSQLTVQPGLQVPFGWLRNIAVNFSEYQMLGGLLQYRPLVSPNHVNASGEVTFSVDYNVGDAAPLSKVQAANADYSTSCAPWERMFQAIECKPTETSMVHRYVRSGAVPNGQDPKTYDWGNINISTQGQSNTTGSIGELYIVYEIAFFKPIATAGLGLSIMNDFFTGTWNSNASVNIGQGTILTAAAGNQIGLTFLATGPTFTFPRTILQGRYLFSLHYSINGSWSAPCGWNAAPVITDGTLATGWSSPTNNNVNTFCPQFTQGPATGSLSDLFLQFVVDVLAPGSASCVVTLPALTNAITGGGRVDAMITQLNSSVSF